MREAQRLIREGSIWIPFCGCWLCEGNLMKNGYGRFQFNNCRISAHRLSYLAFRGPIPEGICVLHNCDTPSCVNPEHLFLGTRVDNMADKIAKGRQTKGKKHWLYGYSVKGERHPMFGRFGENGTGTKLTKNQVREIFRLFEEKWKKKDIASQFQISAQQIGDILRGKKWKHIYAELHSIKL